jgi:hypothetical protein
LSRGLGKVQRGLLLALARIEVGEAERVAQQQGYYQPPTRAGVARILAVAEQHELREHEKPDPRTPQEMAAEYRKAADEATAPADRVVFHRLAAQVLRPPRPARGAP